MGSRRVIACHVSLRINIVATKESITGRFGFFPSLAILTRSNVKGFSVKTVGHSTMTVSAKTADEAKIVAVTHNIDINLLFIVLSSSM